MIINNYEEIIALVELVGDRVLSIRDDHSARLINSIDGFKTQADRIAHDLIYEGLKRFYPNLDIISEEDDSHPEMRPEKYWLIDPIDGTASWYEGFSGFVTQVAYVKNNIPIFGVIYAPVLKKTWYGIIGRGAWLNNEKLSNLQPLHDRLVLIDNYPEPKRVAKKIFESMKVTKYIESGSIGLKCAMVADGTADLFCKDVVVRDWDIAPVYPILKEVGGYICLTNGEQFNFTGPFVKPMGVIIARDENLAKKTINIIENQFCGKIDYNEK